MLTANDTTALTTRLAGMPISDLRGIEAVARELLDALESGADFPAVEIGEVVRLRRLADHLAIGAAAGFEDYEVADTHELVESVLDILFA